MALNSKKAWIIAYDVTCPERLRRVHRYLKTQAIPLQYSVFLAEENVPGIRRLLDRVGALIDPRSDDVRAYPLPHNPEIYSVGRQIPSEERALMTPTLGTLPNLMRVTPARRQRGGAGKKRQPPLQPIEKEGRIT